MMVTGILAPNRLLSTRNSLADSSLTGVPHEPYEGTYITRFSQITHLPSAAYTCASLNWVNIGSDKGLSPVRRRTITWTNHDSLSIGTLEANISEIWSSFYLSASRILEAMDTNVDPCDDFFEYACGSWNREHVIPDDRSNYDTFSKLRDSLQITLKCKY